jgi:hypothetical protein
MTHLHRVLGLQKESIYSRKNRLGPHGLLQGELYPLPSDSEVTN